MFPKQFRVVDEKLLEKIRGQGCCICGRHPVDASHIKTKGSGGPDTDWNVVAHCREHHIEWGISWSRFIRRNPTMAIVLTRLGWSWDNGKLMHPALDAVPLDTTSEIASHNSQAPNLSKSEQIGPQGPEMDVEERRSEKLSKQKRRDLTSSR